LVAASPSTVYRALEAAGRLDRRWQRPTKTGTGFEQPRAPHEHWHLDISYVNVAGTFYYLASILDGYSRFLVHHELRPRMTESEIELLVERALEAQPGAKPRIITDNGPQASPATSRSPFAVEGTPTARRRQHACVGTRTGGAVFLTRPPPPGGSARSDRG
jgi:transposase InsO family protein